MPGRAATRDASRQHSSRTRERGDSRRQGVVGRPAGGPAGGPSARARAERPAKVDGRTRFRHDRVDELRSICPAARRLMWIRRLTTWFNRPFTVDTRHHTQHTSTRLLLVHISIAGEPCLTTSLLPTASTRHRVASGRRPGRCPDSAVAASPARAARCARTAPPPSPAAPATARGLRQGRPQHCTAESSCQRRARSPRARQAGRRGRSGLALDCGTLAHRSRTIPSAAPNRVWRSTNLCPQTRCPAPCARSATPPPRAGLSKGQQQAPR